LHSKRLTKNPFFEAISLLVPTGPALKFSFKSPSWIPFHENGLSTFFGNKKRERKKKNGGKEEVTHIYQLTTLTVPTTMFGCSAHINMETGLFLL
jgi:hypothetical protein